MKVAVLGAGGFIGQHLVRHLSVDHEVVAVVRSTVDLLDHQQVNSFLQHHKFDSIVNAATSHTNDETLTDTRVNLGIFINFYHCSHLFGQYINLASGAEFDRDTNIDLAKEVDIFYRTPKDSYGFSHNIMSRLCYDKDNFNTLRIFGCFGSNEKSTRLLPRLLSASAKFNLSNDRYFDYISVDDLCSIVEFTIAQRPDIKDINCVHQNKIKLSDFVKKFIDIHNLDVELEVNSNSELNYTGNGNNLALLGLGLKGIEFGMKNYVW